MPLDDTILFIITGGTIDSLAEGYEGIALFEDGQKSLIPEIVQSQHKDKKFEFIEFCMKDSGDITDANYDKIIENIATSKHANIIITHGTDTMADVVGYIKRNIKQKGKTVILTGSITPLRVDKTEGMINLDFAINAINGLDKGVYLAMHEKIFYPDNVRKNFYSMRFEEVN